MAYTKKTELTRRKIRQSFLGLLQEKRFEQITVNDIVERAEINRSSFYRYYEDKYTLMRAIEGEIMAGLEGRESVGVGDSPDREEIERLFDRKRITALLLELQKYSEEINILLGPNAGSDFQMRLREKITGNFFSSRNFRLEKTERTSLINACLADLVIETFKRIDRTTPLEKIEELASGISDLFLGGFIQAIINSSK